MKRPFLLLTSSASVAETFQKLSETIFLRFVFFWNREFVLSANSFLNHPALGQCVAAALPLADDSETDRHCHASSADS